jgi:diadenosine tetraphosphatase ApaH/serine/threonine PP2A family protein phosphatase
VRIAVISDIHANRQALEAVLDATREAAVDQLWCLGDLVGYGAEPDACVDLIRASADVCLVGNHDLAVIGSIPLGDFSTWAHAAAEWTQANVRPDTVAYLQSLRPEGVRYEVGLYHASPRDPVWEYVLSPSQAAACFAVQATRLGLIGHSHVALSFWRPADGETSGQPRGEGETLDVTEGQWLINPGSVGQPRDGDPRAAWLEFDLDGGSVTFHRVEYDIDAACAAILGAGLPESLAERLRFGQ